MRAATHFFDLEDFVEHCAGAVVDALLGEYVGAEQAHVGGKWMRGRFFEKA